MNSLLAAANKDVVVPTAIDETVETSGSALWSQSLAQGSGGVDGSTVGSFSVYEMTIEDEAGADHRAVYEEEWETQFLQPKTTVQDKLREQERKRKEARRRRRQRAVKQATQEEKEERFVPKVIKPKRQRFLIKKRAYSPPTSANPNISGHNRTTALPESDEQELLPNREAPKPEDEIWNEAKRRAERLLSGKALHVTPTQELDADIGGGDNDKDTNIFDLTRVENQKASTSNQNATTRIPRGEALYGMPSVSQIGKQYAKAFDSKGKAEKTAAFKNQNAAKQRAIDSEVVVGREEGSENLLKEIDVIKYICLRERLKGNLVAVTRQITNKCHAVVKKRRGVNRAVDSGMLYQVRKQQEIVATLIHELQRASIAVVTSITRWRESVYESQRQRSGPNGTRVTTFRWKGANYLLMMQKDLRFLSRARDERLNKRRAPKRPPANRGLLSGGIGGGIITKSEPGSESEYTLAEKFVNPVAYWLGFEPEEHPLLVPPSGLNVLEALQHERMEIEALAAKQLKHEQEERANALRAAHMARISGVRVATPQEKPQGEELKVKEEEQNALPRTNVSTSGSMMSVTSDEMLEENSTVVEEANIDDVTASSSKVEDGGGGDNDGEEEVAVDEPSIPWTFWVVDMYPSEPLAKVLPEKSHRLYHAALEVLRNERGVEKQWRNLKEAQETPDSGYDPVARIADQGGIDFLLTGVTETKLMEDTGVVSRLRNRQQNRNLRKADATMRPSHPDHVDAGVTVALGVSTNRIRNTAERAIEDSRPHVLPASPGAPNSKLLGTILIGELPMNTVRRQNAILNHAASLIQAMCRGVLDRAPNGPIEKKIALRKERQEFAATGLQSLIRGRIARQEVEEIRFNLPSMEPNVAATMIQGMVRTYFARKSMEIERVYLKTVLMQAAADGKEARDAAAAKEAATKAATAATDAAKQQLAEDTKAAKSKSRRRRKPVLIFSGEQEVPIERPSSFVEKKRAEVEEAREKEAVETEAEASKEENIGPIDKAMLQ
jgi:predicted nucleic acid-binding protein